MNGPVPASLEVALTMVSLHGGLRNIRCIYMLTSLSKPPGNTFERFLLKFCLTNLLILSIQVTNTVSENSCVSFCEKMVMGRSLEHQSFLI